MGTTIGSTGDMAAMVVIEKRVCVELGSAVLFGIAYLTGCASEPVPVGTKFLGQVAYVGPATDAANLSTLWTPQTDDALDGWLPRRVDTGTTKELAASCNLDDDPNSRFALVRLFYSYGSKHGGLFLHSEWALVGVEAPVERGNVIELQMRQGSSRNSRCATVTTIRAKTLGDGCFYAPVQKRSDGLYFYRSLYCRDLESEGWKELTDPFPWGHGNNELNWRLTPLGGNGIGWYKPPPGQTK